MGIWADKLKALNQPVDGCTASPNGNWRDCCDEHDYHYSEHDVARVEADATLAVCITKKGHPGFGALYFLAVRFMGLGFWNKAKFDDKGGLLNG